MRNHLGHYKPDYTEPFKQQLRSLPLQLRQRTMSKVLEILEDPWHNQEAMKGQYKGTTHRYITGKDRIIFVVCEDCRENGWKVYNNCTNCHTYPDWTVTFADIILGHKY